MFCRISSSQFLKITKNVCLNFPAKKQYQFYCSIFWNFVPKITFSKSSVTSKMSWSRVLPRDCSRLGIQTAEKLKRINKSQQKSLTSFSMKVQKFTFNLLRLSCIRSRLKHSRDLVLTHTRIRSFFSGFEFILSIV